MKRFKRVVLAILIIILVIVCVGCNKNNKTILLKEYNRAKKEVMIGTVDITELKESVEQFIYKVYSPKSEEDIVKGAELIKQYTTENEYNQIVSNIMDYDESINTGIVEMSIVYGNGKNMYDSMNRVYATFSTKAGNKIQNRALEFVLNNENKIFKHYIWSGSIG